MHQPILRNLATTTWSLPLCFLLAASPSAAQNCFGIQQTFGNAVSSVVDDAGRMAVLTDGQPTGTLEIFSLDPVNERFQPDSVVGAVSLNNGGGSEWHLDLVDSYVAAGATGLFTGNANGNAFVAQRTGAGYLVSPPLAGFVPPNPAGASQSTGSDIGLAWIGERMLAFVGDPAGINPAVNVDGAVDVFDVTDPQFPCYVTRIFRPGVSVLNNSLFGDSLDLVQTSQYSASSDAGVRLIIGAPNACGNEVPGPGCATTSLGVAYVFNVESYDPETKELGFTFLQQLTAPAQAPNNINGFATSVEISDSRAIVGTNYDGFSAVTTLNSVVYDRVGPAYVQGQVFLGPGADVQVSVSASGNHIIARPVQPGVQSVHRLDPMGWAPVTGTLAPGDSYRGTGVSSTILSVAGPGNNNSSRAGGRLSCQGPLEEYTFFNSFCDGSNGVAVPNSTGVVASISSVNGNFGQALQGPNLTFTTTGVPPLQASLMISSLSSNPAGNPFGGLSGVTCVGPPVVFHTSTLGSADATGVFSAVLNIADDYDMLNQTSVFFQTYHRDATLGPTVVNFSDTVELILSF